MLVAEKVSQLIDESPLISRDLSWLKFNYRVLDQAKKTDRSIFERLKFIAITASNLDEFFMIRVGSLYNYIDYNKERVDYSGLREIPFRKMLLHQARVFINDQNYYFAENLKPHFEENGFRIASYDTLDKDKQQEVNSYFERTIFPMLTPMAFDSYHTFPLLMNNRLIFGVVTKSPDEKSKFKKISFIQIPRNLPRFYEIDTPDGMLFIPIEGIIMGNISKMFRNVDILSTSLFRITRNGDFTLEESEDIEANFLDELQQKLKTRRTGRVVRVEVFGETDEWMLQLLKERWELDEYNIFQTGPDQLIDYTSLWQIVNHNQFKDKIPSVPAPILPLNYPEQTSDNIFEILKEREIMLHHPYNNMEPLLELVEEAAEDPNVLAIKITIYRLAKDSRITEALRQAAENGKHVAVLFEVKARFDEENNLIEAQKLQKAGCYVIYGFSSFKTHTKLLLIVRKEEDQVRRYVHMSSGNYNEVTSRLYTDIGIMTTDDDYANDVSEFFNVITGHSQPATGDYKYLITAPNEMRDRLIAMIHRERENAQKGLESAIVIKINSLQDKDTILALYEASKAGVKIKLVIRGICCLRPGRKGLSENIVIHSIIGDFLEHSRLYYFHNNGDSEIYSGSADTMMRSFDRRLESIFLIKDPMLKKQAINILRYNLLDNVNSYEMNEFGEYHPIQTNSDAPFNIHKEFFSLQKSDIEDVTLV